MENMENFENNVKTTAIHENNSILPEKIDINKKLEEKFPKSNSDELIINTCLFLDKLEKEYPIVKRLKLKEAMTLALVSSMIGSTPAFALNPDYANNQNLKPTTKISANEYIPKGFPGQNETINNNLEQNYDRPSVRINSIPSGVNWIMPDNMSSSDNPDYYISSEDCGWIPLENNSHNINPSISFNNFSINFGTSDSNQSYIYRVGIEIRDKYNNLVAKIYGESPICNKDNYNSFNVGFSTNHFSTGYSQNGSSGEQYVDENTKNTLYLHNAKQIAFENALRNIPALKPLTPNNTNQYPSQQYSANYTENSISQAQAQPTKINFCNPFDLNTPITHDTILYTDYGPKVKINYLETGKTKIITINQYPFNIMSAIDPNYGGTVEIKILQENGKTLNDTYNKIFTIEKPQTK